MNVQHPEDARLLERVAELEAADATFRRLWAAQKVGSRRHTTKSFDHPAHGAVSYDFETLYLPEDGLRISVYARQPRPRRNPGGGDHA
ncbi:hypothetical protein G4X40_04100 [Rhodococcus sp. D2-41]|nr:hypothetical protein [Rhodococcus sp. D2-41]